MGAPWQPTMPVESMQQLLFMSNFIFSFMISIHSRVVHLSHLKEMSAIFSITTDINVTSQSPLPKGQSDGRPMATNYNSGINAITPVYC